MLLIVGCRIGGQKGRELVELLLPEDPVFHDPRLRITQRRSDESTSAYAPVASDIGESRALQHAQVLGDAGERHVELRGEFADRPLAAREVHENGAPRRIGERAEGDAQRLFVGRDV